MIIETVSLQGQRHKDKGIPNQDAVQWKEHNGRLIFAVCDGVSLDTMGRVSHSEEASDYCAIECVKRLEAQDRPLQEVFHEVSEGLIEHLEDMGLVWFDNQTTMIAGSFKDHKLKVGIAGDGGVIVRKTDGTAMAIMTKPKRSSEVEPLFFESGWRFFEAEDVDALVAATDGIFDGLVYVKDGEVEFNSTFIGAFFQAAREKERAKLLETLCGLIPTGDDQTCLLAEDSTL